MERKNMNKPIFTECPLCGKICMIDEPHEEVKTKRKAYFYIHLLCAERKRNETVTQKD